MNIKGLLLGSAAALVAVSGARAADAVVIAEPEPVEYVRVCDTYGVGFYYIPGTETCLKVSGYLRYDINVGYKGLNNVLDRSEFWDDGSVEFNDTYDKQARFALRLDSRAETELGTLRTYSEVEFNWDMGTAPSAFGGDTLTVNSQGVNLAHAYIELGGFKVGKTDSLFSTFTGYTSGVTNDGLVPAGPFDTLLMQYNYVGGNGFNAAVSLEVGGGSDIAPFNTYTGPTWVDLYTLDSYIPHVVGGLGYTAGWGGISGVVGYDSVSEEVAVKGRVDFNASDALSFFVMAAWASVDEDWADDFNNGFNDSPNYYAPWGGDWAAWVGGAWKINEKATFNWEVGYDELEDFSVAANVDYELVHNFHVIPEVIYVDNFSDDFEDIDETKENWGARLRLQANFGG